MTNTEIKASTDAVVKELAKAGIKAKGYAKSPLAGTSSDVFSISLDQQNVVRLWAGTAKINVIPSGATHLKQAVLQVHEKGRVVKREYEIDYVTWDRTRNLEPRETVLQRINTIHGEWWVRNNLGTQLPQGAEYSITAFNRTAKPESGSLDPDYGTATLEGRVTGSRQNFLIGRDERSQFISVLPRQVTSVKEAHDALRPKGVPSSALRQGEWFFVPATRDEQRTIENSIKARGSQGLYPVGYSYSIDKSQIGQLEPNSSHHAPCLITVNSKRYAAGLVYDSRANRHGSLMLAGWHRVIRNREVINSATQNRSGARYD